MLSNRRRTPMASQDASPQTPSETSKPASVKMSLPSMDHPLLSNKYIFSSKSNLQYERIILRQAIAAARASNCNNATKLPSLPKVRFDVSAFDAQKLQTEKRDNSSLSSSPADVEEPAPKRRRYQRRNSKCPSMFFPQLANFSVLASPSSSPCSQEKPSSSTRDPFESHEVDDVLSTAEDLVRTLKARHKKNGP
mmetsp:Transcript_26556/g.37415  ORF Transcript_26556/g.37415 Transcript_26556/m.37415 type:complete len:194 (-) Transcript_26556:321-902(-)